MSFIVAVVPMDNNDKVTLQVDINNKNRCSKLDGQSLFFVVELSM